MARLRIETAPEITVYDESFVIKAAANATAPLIQLKDSSGANVGNISSSGVLTVASVVASNAGTSSTDLATRAYVDAISAGTNWHEAVAWGTNEPLPACTYSNGTNGVGATLTGNAFGALVVDAATVEQGEAILVKDQVDAKQNGIYAITNTGGASEYFVLTRREDADNSPAGEVVPGDAVYVVNGAATVGNSYVITSAGTGADGQISIGVDDIIYSVFAGTASTQPGAGLARDGYTINIVSADASRIQVNADSIDLATMSTNVTGGSSTTTFVDSITIDSYGRTTSYRTSSVDFTGYAFSANSALTGTPTAPTANAGTNTTQIATTEFVEHRALAAESNAANSAGNIFIQKSSFDAKGDILIGSADDTVSKLSVGTDGYFLKANSNAGVGVEWASIPTINNLDDVGDVTITGNATGQFLKYDGSAWINSSVPTINNLNDVGDVTISSVTSGDFLKYNGSAWVNDPIDLGTDTTGNYMVGVSAGTGISVSHTPGEGSSATISVDATIATLNSPTFTGTVAGITATMVGLGNVDNTSDANKPVSTAGQTALNLKANLASPTFTGTVAGITATMVGLGNVDNTSDVNKPVSTAQQTALNLKANLASPTFTGTPTLPTGTIATTQTAGNNSTAVATTAFVSTAVANLVASAPAALNTLDELAAAFGDDANFATTVTTNIGLKAPIDSPTFTGTVSGISATMVGLGNVDNTSDANKPVSTAQQTALNLKANLASPTFTGTVSGISATMVGLGNVDNTSDANKPVSTATQTALNLKANLASPTFTGTVTLPANTVTSAMIAQATIVDADISTTAAIDQGKIADTVLNQQVASYTLVLTDKNKMVEIFNSSATTLTIPADDSVNFGTGATIVILQTGTGQVTLTAGAGVTLNATPGAKLRTQWSSATLVKRAANTWVALGDLSA